MTLPRSAALLLVVFASVASAPAAVNPQDPTSQPPPRSREQIVWLTEQALPFDTVEAGHGFGDLMPLKELIGDARIVALGEPTHGSREVFQMKHRLVEFLASEMDFTIFSIEANMPEAYRVNDHVARGEGDPAALIEGMYFWTWGPKKSSQWSSGCGSSTPRGAGTSTSRGSTCRHLMSPCRSFAISSRRSIPASRSR